MTSKQKLKKALALIEEVLEEGDLYDNGLDEVVDTIEEIIEINME